MKRGLIWSFHKIPSTLRQEQDLFMKSVAWNMMLSLKVIHKVSLTWLLIPRVAVVRTKKSLWALYIPYMKGV